MNLDGPRLRSASRFLLLLLGIVLMRTAWLSDDAYITFRVVDNFLHGHGLTWNVHERVQAYTHPLWMFCLIGSRLLIPHIFFSSLVVSLLVTAFTIYVMLWRLARTEFHRVLVLALFIGSKAWVDFSTSGLENPLTHLLLALFLWNYSKGEDGQFPLLPLTLISGLLLTNRMDCGVLVLPFLAVAYFRQIPRSTGFLNDSPLEADSGQTRRNTANVRGMASFELVKTLLLGLAPFIAWELFSVIYYGFPFPNTAYAKLSHGIPTAELVPQGLRYIVNSLTTDPLTLPTICLAAMLPALTRRFVFVPATVGMLLYLLYVVRIGGDFMSGRFFSGPFLLAVGVLARAPIASPRLVVSMLLAGVLLPLAGPRPNLFSGSDYGRGRRPIAPDGIVDERSYYFKESGLWQGDLTFDKPISYVVNEGRAFAARAEKEGPTFTVSGFIGFGGFFSGSKVTVMDRLALSEPLLARLPARRDVPWRIGHFERTIPYNYVATVKQGTNQISHPALREYYEHLKVVTQGNLWSVQRMTEIWKFNQGAYDGLLNDYTDPAYREIHAGKLNPYVPSGAPFDLENNQLLSDQGIKVTFDGLVLERGLKLSMCATPGIWLTFFRREEKLGTLDLPRTHEFGDRMAEYIVRVPEEWVAGGYDAIWIQPQGEGMPRSVGHLIPISLAETP